MPANFLRSQIKFILKLYLKVTSLKLRIDLTAHNLIQSILCRNYPSMFYLFKPLSPPQAVIYSDRLQNEHNID